VPYRPHDLPGGEQTDETTEWVPTFPMPAGPVARGPRRVGWWAAVLAGIAGSVVTVVTLTALGVINDEANPRASSATTAPAPQVIEVREIVTDGAGGFSAAAVGRKVTPSVVTVEVGAQSSAGEFTQFGVGSGVVFRSDGFIVTNHHVVTDADLMRVVFQDGSTYVARLVGSDPSTDLAVLQIDAIGLTTAELGATDGLTIGDAAVAVGNPLGLAGGASLTVGVLSAFDRRVTAADAETLFGMIQTDAPITQGSSGGALVDTSGRLIGITTAIGVSSAGAEGIGFAVPVEVVARVTDELVATGTVQHAFLGVQLDDFLLDRPDGATRPGGATITTFPDGITSAAAAAGLLEGDVIIALGGLPVTTSDDVISRLRRLRVGDSVEVDVSRDGNTLTFSVVLGTRPEDL
jgi:S1-C subfamily serine protease